MTDRRIKNKETNRKDRQTENHRKEDRIGYPYTTCTHDKNKMHFKDQNNILLYKKRNILKISTPIHIFNK